MSKCRAGSAVVAAVRESVTVDGRVGVGGNRCRAWIAPARRRPTRLCERHGLDAGDRATRRDLQQLDRLGVAEAPVAVRRNSRHVQGRSSWCRSGRAVGADRVAAGHSTGNSREAWKTWQASAHCNEHTHPDRLPVSVDRRDRANAADRRTQCICVSTNSPTPTAGPSRVANTIITNGFATMTGTPAHNRHGERQKQSPTGTSCPSTLGPIVRIHIHDGFVTEFFEVSMIRGGGRVNPRTALLVPYCAVMSCFCGQLAGGCCCIATCAAQQNSFR